MSEIKITSVFLIVGGALIVGLPGFFAVTQPPPQDLLAVAGYGLVGVFAVLSGVGLWRLKRWGMYLYFLFFAIRCVLRFPDLLTGDLYEIFRYVFWAVAWLLPGWYVWKKVNAEIARSQ